MKLTELRGELVQITDAEYEKLSPAKGVFSFRSSKKGVGSHKTSTSSVKRGQIQTEKSKTEIAQAVATFATEWEKPLGIRGKAG